MPWQRAAWCTMFLGVWRTPHAAYDGDVETSARTEIPPGPAESERIHFHWEPACSTTSVRMLLRTPVETLITYYRVLTEGVPDLEGQIVAPAGTNWQYISFSRRTLETVALAWEHSESETVDVAIHEIEALTPCRGPLGPLCEIFHNVGDFFSGLADNISGVFIIGEHLAGPFGSLADMFHNLGDKCCEVSGNLQDVLDVLAEGVTLEHFAALLERYFPLLYYLVVDPPGQVRYLIAQAFDLTPYEAQSAEFIIKTLFERWFPSLYLLWRDPQRWLAENLEEHVPLLYYLVVDPKGQMLYLIAQLFDLTPYEAQSPEMIVKVLFERYFPELYLIWRDPLRWLIDMLLGLEEDIVRPIADKLSALGEHLLRLIWEGEW